MAQWVLPESFDASKISTAVVSNSAGYERSKILYKYDDDVPPRDLLLTVPRNPDAYVLCRGVKKDLYTIGDTKVETSRYGAQLILKADNDYHVELYGVLEKIGEKIKEITRQDAVFPVKDMGDYSILYTNLIHSNDGKMFSSAYTSEDKIDILDVKQSIVRPSLILSLLKKSPAEIKVKIQISQMYVHSEIKNFPLANMD